MKLRVDMKAFPVDADRAPNRLLSINIFPPQRRGNTVMVLLKLDIDLRGRPRQVDELRGPAHFITIAIVGDSDHFTRLERRPKVDESAPRRRVDRSGLSAVDKHANGSHIAADL